MNINWNDIIMPVLNDLLIPEILNFIKNYAASNNGALPTEAELKEALTVSVKEGLSIWDAWNTTHPKQ